MHKVPKILCLATMALFLLVMLQERRQIISMRELKGAYTVTDLPKPAFRTLADGSWQREAEKYLRANHGFHEAAIRLYNQYAWSLFRQSTNVQVMVGGDGYLYERYFVEDFHESRMYKYTESPEELLAKFDREASRLAKLQAILAEAGTTIFVAILPGKDQIYPEYVPRPDSYFKGRTPGPRAIEAYPPLFDRYGIHHTNVCQWFKDLRGVAPFPLMTKQGTHWSNIASVYAFDSIMRFMQSAGGAHIPAVTVGAPYYADTREPDNDLAELLNLIRTPRGPRNQYADVALAEPAGDSASRPGMIVIGDSFFWNVSYNFPLDSLFRYCYYWFYNNTAYFDPQHDNVSQYDLAATLLDADYVMLSYCSGQLYDLGNEFISQALVRLCYDECDIQAVRDSLTHNVNADPAWRQQIADKAAAQGISFDEALRTDCDYLIFTNPESYFPELAADTVPARRCSLFRKH